MKTMVRAIAALCCAAILVLNLYIELAPRYTVLLTWKLGFAAAFALTLAVAFFFGFSQGMKQRRFRDYIMILFWYYIWVLLNVLFFDNAFGRGFSFDQSLSAVNLEPFLTIHNYLRAYELGNISLYIVILNLAGNLVAFAPMGLFLPALFRWQRSIFFFLASLTLMITTVEVTQIYTGAGSMDIDDLILNLAGALLVFLLCRLTPLWRRICAVSPRGDRKDEVYDV